MRTLHLGQAPVQYEQTALNRIFAAIESHSLETDTPISGNTYDGTTGGTSATVVVGTDTSTSTDPVMVQLVADMKKKGILR